MNDSIFLPDDKWATRVLKIRDELYLTEWGKELDEGPEFLPTVPDIEVFKLLPNGGSETVGVLGENGVFDIVRTGPLQYIVVDVADWSEIEVLPEWEYDK